MYIKSIEVDGMWGMNLDDVVRQIKLMTRKYSAEEVYCIFNTHRIDSNMTLDEVYLKVLGKTKQQFDEDQRIRREEQEKRDREYEDSIPELIKIYIERAKGIIPEDKIDYWNEIVPVRLKDLYHGMELDSTLKLVKMLDIDNCTFQEAKTEIDNQGHSGMSYGLECMMLRAFSNRGEEFVLYLKSN